MNELKREDIVGQTIKRIHARAHTRDSLDFTETYYTLTTGVVFFMPLAISPFVASRRPWNAWRLRGSVIDRCTGSPIARVLAIQEQDGFIDPESLLVEFESGDCLSDTWVAPHGVGMTGLRCYHPGKLDLSRYRDYWTLDREADASA